MAAAAAYVASEATERMKLVCRCWTRYKSDLGREAEEVEHADGAQALAQLHKGRRRTGREPRRRARSEAAAQAAACARRRPRRRRPGAWGSIAVGNGAASAAKVQAPSAAVRSAGATTLASAARVGELVAAGHGGHDGPVP